MSENVLHIYFSLLLHNISKARKGGKKTHQRQQIFKGSEGARMEM